MAAGVIPETLRFASCLAPNVLPMYEAVAAFVGERLNVPTTIEECDDYDRWAAAEQDDVHFVCSLPYVEVAKLGPPEVEVIAAPVLEGERYGGKPVYYSDVIVARDAPFRSFAELRGTRWAYNEPRSHSGYGITRYTLVRMGETNGFFGEVIEAGFHQDSIRMVADGEIDASAIDSQVLEVELRDHPEIGERIRVIESLGPSSIQPVTVAKRLPEGFRREIQKALIEIGDHPDGRRALHLGLVRRFVPADDETYADIVEMVDACEAAGFMELR
ncbi:MAG: phosphate/phosphite/phosphonate ABC transporter substrate-binding protein [Actinomycetota bacterium]